MRLLLDAHLSAKRIGARLEQGGHDVLALSRERALEGLEDEQVLALATSESRVLITNDVSDFPPLLREWAEAGRSHSGVILVYGLRPSEFEAICRGIEDWLTCRPEQAEWVDFVAIASRPRSR